MQLALHVAELAAYLQTIGISSLGLIEGKVDELCEMTKAFDQLTADLRSGRREGSDMTACL